MEPVEQFATNSDPSSTAVKLTSVLPAIKSGKADYNIIKTNIILSKFILTCIDYLKIYTRTLYI